MLQYPATFLVSSVFAAILGFGSLAGLVADIAQILFFVFLGIFLLSFIFNGPSPRN
ncbi:MAG: DUF1328 domain-containing protein [Methylacidiphilales bacterium]|nr:DUF1328 domain-containing protein [Candidatus Methylacidiphilales bacterium]